MNNPHIYITRNISNNMIYAGVHQCHSSCNKICSYLGSGLYLKRAIKTYGKDCFIVESRTYFKTLADAFEFEELLVDVDWVARSDTYNLTTGGRGGSEKGVRKMGDVEKQKRSQRFSGSGNPNFGKITSDETRKKMRERKVGRPSQLKGRTLSAERKAAISITSSRPCPIKKIRNECTRVIAKIQNCSFMFAFRNYRDDIDELVNSQMRKHYE